MKKKILSICMTLVLTLSFAACGEGDTLSDAEAKEAMLVEDYESLLKEYYDAVMCGTEPANEDLYMMYSEVVGFDDTTKEQCGYCFYDIDRDGNEELIIGMGSSVWGIANNVTGTVNLLKGAGYRSVLDILTDGTVVYEGSSGAACYSYDLYEYDGENLIIKDFYYSDWADNEDGVAYYHNTTGEWTDAEEELITEEEFEAIGAKVSDKTDFSEMFEPISGLKDRFAA